MVKKIIKKLKDQEKFTHDKIKEIPHNKGVYCAWLDASELIYVGKATNAENGGLDNRIRSHYSGQRGSDQFCLYLFDSYIKKIPEGIGADVTKKINETTKKWSRENVSFSFIELEDGDDESCIESQLRKKLKPKLNPKT